LNRPHLWRKPPSPCWRFGLGFRIARNAKRSTPSRCARKSGLTRCVAALVGDLATENDARRLARSQAPVRQIITGTICHLDAAMIEKNLAGWDLSALDFLFIENVGNMVCPSSYDLGENLRIVLLSVTEGEDKPLKYPHHRQ
jgi:hydrogenase accessory protein HypB